MGFHKAITGHRFLYMITSRPKNPKSKIPPVPSPPPRTRNISGEKY